MNSDIDQADKIVGLEEAIKQKSDHFDQMERNINELVNKLNESVDHFENTVKASIRNADQKTKEAEATLAKALKSVENNQSIEKTLETFKQRIKDLEKEISERGYTISTLNAQISANDDEIMELRNTSHEHISRSAACQNADPSKESRKAGLFSSRRKDRDRLDHEYELQKKRIEEDKELEELRREILSSASYSEEKKKFILGCWKEGISLHDIKCSIADPSLSLDIMKMLKEYCLNGRK